MFIELSERDTDQLSPASEQMFCYRLKMILIELELHEHDTKENNTCNCIRRTLRIDSATIRNV